MDIELHIYLYETLPVLIPLTGLRHCEIKLFHSELHNTPRDPSRLNVAETHFVGFIYSLAS